MDRPRRQNARWRRWALAASLLMGCGDEPPRSRIVAPDEPRMFCAAADALPIDSFAGGRAPSSKPPARGASSGTPSAAGSGFNDAGLVFLRPGGAIADPARVWVAPAANLTPAASGLGATTTASVAGPSLTALPVAGPTTTAAVPASSAAAPQHVSYPQGRSYAAAPQYVAPPVQYVIVQPQYAGPAPQAGAGGAYGGPQILVQQPSGAALQYAPASQAGLAGPAGGYPQYVLQPVAPQAPAPANTALPQAPASYVVAQYPAQQGAPAYAAPQYVVALQPGANLPPGARPDFAPAWPTGPAAAAPTVDGGPTTNPRRESEIATVNRQAEERVKQGFHLAERGAMHSARAECIQALRMIAQALDAQESSAAHCEALWAGLTALREARDFDLDRRGGASEDGVEIGLIIAGHRTPVLQRDRPENLNALVAQQKYLTYAQEQLVIAAGRQSAASMALYGIGRIAAMSAGTPSANALGDTGVAVASYQAALAVNEGNFRAGNELGVILGNCGRLEAARDVFLRSLSASPHAVIWRNLASVHERLGQSQLAAQALAQANAAPDAKSVPVDVAWLDPQTFTQTATPPDAAPPRQAQPAPVAGAPSRTGNTARLPGANLFR